MVSSADDSGPEIGLTGARFGGAARRRARAAPEPAAALDDGPADAVGLTGARFGGASRRHRDVLPAAPPAVETPTPVPVPQPPVAHLPLEDSPYAKVRPYVLTGGRTRAGVEFAVEALITSVAVPPRPEPVEHTRIRALCARPRSVAEVAALTGVPLGVARVLLGDMLVAGAISVHRTADAGGPDLALMERVLSGLRRL
jgi:hypothetical protein